MGRGRGKRERERERKRGREGKRLRERERAFLQLASMQKSAFFKISIPADSYARVSGTFWETMIWNVLDVKLVADLIFFYPSLSLIRQLSYHFFGRLKFYATTRLYLKKGHSGLCFKETW